MPAFLPAAPLPRPAAAAAPPSARRSVCRRPPRAVLSPAPSRAVLDYERFLRAETSSGNPLPDAPVFETADGALVCAWNPAPDLAAAPAAPPVPAQDNALSAMLCIADYEAFLATDQAHGVDPRAPVYCTPDAALVCHYDD